MKQTAAVVVGEGGRAGAGRGDAAHQAVQEVAAPPGEALREFEVPPGDILREVTAAPESRSLAEALREVEAGPGSMGEEEAV